MVYFITICIGFALGCLYMLIAREPNKDGDLYIMMNDQDQEAIGGVQFNKSAKEISHSKYVVLEVHSRDDINY